MRYICIIKLKQQIMKKVTRLSKKAIQFCELSGYDVETIKVLMKSNSFAFYKCESADEIKGNGVLSEYPYLIYNPFNFNLIN